MDDVTHTNDEGNGIRRTLFLLLRTTKFMSFVMHKTVIARVNSIQELLTHTILKRMSCKMMSRKELKSKLGRDNHEQL